MSETIGVGKLKRSYLMHFIDASFGGETPNWFLIGKDIDDMSVDLGPDTSSVKNVWDETNVQDNGYEPKLSAETYYADTNDAIYPKLKQIAMERLTGDDCKTKILEVIVDKVTGPYEAYQEDALIKPQSYGGAQGGVNIPFEVSFAGNREKGTATVTDKVPVFTKTTI